MEANQLWNVGILRQWISVPGKTVEGSETVRVNAVETRHGGRLSQTSPCRSRVVELTRYGEEEGGVAVEEEEGECEAEDDDE